MDTLEEGFYWHPLCIPAFTPVPGMGGLTMYDAELREELTDVIWWGQRSAKRSQQVRLGCSEVGNECDRRIGYTMAGVQGPNTRTDQWPATVGTAVHEWMEKTFTSYQQVHGVDEWVTEMEVHPSPLVPGHTDLYHPGRGLVLDWKFPSSDNLSKMRKQGVSRQYMVQVQLYGLGHLLAGRKVERVGIAAISRSGWLKDMFVHTVEFDRTVADTALERVYALGKHLIEVDIGNNVDEWNNVPASPSRLCMYCPFYRRGAATANDLGCPGK